jgi:micrococcal nuclease
MIRIQAWALVSVLAVVVAAAVTAVVATTAPAFLSCTGCPLVPVKHVIDGDTFDSTHRRVRLYGINAPELGEECFSEATERLRELVGDEVRLELGPRKKDKFGRVLAYVYTEAGDSVDETLVREGLATAWARDGQHRDVLAALEREAQEQGTGCLW